MEWARGPTTHLNSDLSPPSRQQISKTTLFLFFTTTTVLSCCTWNRQNVSHTALIPFGEKLMSKYLGEHHAEN